MSGAILGLIGVLLTLAGQAQPGATSSPAPLLQNERVTVWDYTWKKGTASPIGRRDEDCVILFVTPDAGHVVWQAKGTVAAEPAAADGAVLRAKVTLLHDRPAPVYPNKSGFPGAFPRAGSKQVLDNARVTVWDYTFTAGSPSPMHFHDRDVVVTYFGAGALRSTTPDGQAQANEYATGDTRFNPGNRTHTELLTRGSLRIVAMELK